MHPFIWAALGAVLATPVVVVATLFVALLRQAMNTNQVSSLARQERLGPRKGVTSGRVSGRISGDFCVFIIGAHLNSPRGFFGFKRLGDLFQGMLGELAVCAPPTMQHRLEADALTAAEGLQRAPEDVGFLGGQVKFGLVVQYWRSADHLNAWARKPSALHFPTWVEYNKVVARTRDETIGLWHESYQVKADQYETIYLTCQPIGMMLAGDEVVPASGKRATAAGRAGLKNLTDLPAGVPQLDDAGLLIDEHNKEE